MKRSKLCVLAALFVFLAACDGWLARRPQPPRVTSTETAPGNRIAGVRTVAPEVWSIGRPPEGEKLHLGPRG